MPNDKRFINFDALDYTPVEITKRGRTWTLRDDIPMRVMARCFTLVNFWPDFQARIARAAENGEEAAKTAIEDAFAEMQATMVPLVGDIFRHTLPETTDEQIAAWFSDEEMRKIIDIFFTHRSQSLSAPSPNPPAKPVKANQRPARRVR